MLLEPILFAPKSNFGVIVGHLLPLTQINSKGQYAKVQPFAVFCAERGICPTLTPKWFSRDNAALAAHPSNPQMGNTLSMSHLGIFHDAHLLPHSDDKMFSRDNVDTYFR